MEVEVVVVVMTAWCPWCCACGGGTVGVDATLFIGQVSWARVRSSISNILFALAVALQASCARS